MPLVTERLLLRPKTPADVEPLAAVRADAEYARFLSGRPYTRDEVVAAVHRDLQHQRRHGFSMFAVELRETAQVIGDAGLHLYEWEGPEIEVGWRLGRAFWGHGYATEAGGAALAFAFDDLELDRVIAVAHVGNEASIRVMEKLGMRYERLVVAYGKESVLYAAQRL